MNFKECFKPSFAKLLWFMGFFIISFESLWIRILCIEGSCYKWYLQLIFWIFSWPFALGSLLHFTSGVGIIIGIVFFILVPCLYYYFLSCVMISILPKRIRKK